MNEGKIVLRWGIIVDSILIVVLVVFLFVEPGFSVLLPLAGALAGLNVVLQARSLDNLDPGLRQTLQAVGGAAILAMAILILMRLFS